MLIHGDEYYTSDTRKKPYIINTPLNLNWCFIRFPFLCDFPVFWFSEIFNSKLDIYTCSIYKKSRTCQKTNSSMFAYIKVEYKGQAARQNLMPQQVLVLLFSDYSISYNPFTHVVLDFFVRSKLCTVILVECNSLMAWLMKMKSWLLDWKWESFHSLLLLQRQYDNYSQEKFTKFLLVDRLTRRTTTTTTLYLSNLISNWSFEWKLLIFS